MARTKKIFWFRWWVLVILVIVVAAAGYKIYDRISLSANRRAFQNARTAIDNIYFDSVKQIGPADNAQISSDCSRVYQEFSGYGDLSCEVDTKFIYAVNDENDANDMFKHIQNIIKESKLLKPSKELSSHIQDSLIVNTVYRTAHDYYTGYGLTCEASYIFDTPRQMDLSLRQINKKGLETIIGCRGPAKQQYYRLAS